MTMITAEKAAEIVARIPEREIQRMTRQLERAVEMARAMRAGTVRTVGGLEPTRLLLPRAAEKIARGQW